ncbi:hypothetical protein CAFE_17350 [Caprobacter fermentans]|uniref:Uncharacterized protein n=1 Tax=Caproicibacter fermentans TaxID=2576756 RepID=A0A6N8I0E8_9FIRM|nr:hypothetical protein [Caproicibacter fermentans]MVB11033.1 hypothetical protein [Caproicibacter fermentans]QNK39354.1 hypothetical protein HCR03_11365 [Caproicibacter fermentans]
MEHKNCITEFLRKYSFLTPICLIAAVVSLTVAIVLVLRVVGMPSFVLGLYFC